MHSPLHLLFHRLGGGGEVRTCSSRLPGGGETAARRARSIPAPLAAWRWRFSRPGRGRSPFPPLAATRRGHALSGYSDGGEVWPRSSRLLRRWSGSGEARPHSLCSSVGWAAVARCGRAPLCSPAAGRPLRAAPALSPLLCRRGSGASLRPGLAALPFLLWRRRGVATLFLAISAVERRWRGAAALPLLFRWLAGRGEMRTCSSLLPGGIETAARRARSIPAPLVAWWRGFSRSVRRRSPFSSTCGGEAWPSSSRLLWRWSGGGETRAHSLCSSVGWPAVGRCGRAPPCSLAAARLRRGAPALSPLLWRCDGRVSLGPSAAALPFLL